VVPAIHTSSYLVGHTENYDEKVKEVKKAEIIRGFKTQCGVVSAGIEAAIRRAIEENVSLIMEGIHIIPGKIRESAIYKENYNRFIECIIHIDDSEIHKSRFLLRSKYAPKRVIDKYLHNFTEI